MKKRTQLLLILSLAFLLCLTSCGGNDGEDETITEDMSQSQEEDPVESQEDMEDDAQTSETAPLILIATQEDDITYPDLAGLSYSQVLDSQKAGLDTLISGEGDVLLMSVLDAARAYGDYDIQILAIVGEEDDSLYCLALRSGALAEDTDAYLALLTDYEAALNSDVLFAADWDMMDIVQDHLETLFETMDSPDFYIPDSKFYAFLVS